MGRHELHPQSVRHDDRVHAGRAHRSDGALSRRRSSTSAATKRPRRSGRRARARRQRMQGARASTTRDELQSWFIDARWMRSSRRTVAGSSAGTRSSRAASRRTPSVMSWRGTARRHRRGARRPRRRHGAAAATRTSITINLETRDAEPLAIGGFLPLDYGLLVRARARRARAAVREAHSRRAGSAVDRVHRRAEAASSTWRSRAQRRSPRCCGRRRTGASWAISEDGWSKSNGGLWRSM